MESDKTCCLIELEYHYPIPNARICNQIIADIYRKKYI